MLRRPVGAENAHVSTPLCTQPLGKYSKIHRVAAGIHEMQVVVKIHHVIAETQHFYRIIHQ